MTLLPKQRSGTQSGDGAPIRGLLPLALGLILWQIFGAANSPYFPPPSEMGPIPSPHFPKAGRLWPAVGTTLMHFALALLISVIVGFGLGIMLGRRRTMDRLLRPGV